MKATLLRAADFKRALWKNGLGHTDEIAIHPPTADLRRGDFLWRLSSARIEQASPFSLFPEHDRALVVIAGQGLRLTHTLEEGEETVELPALSAYDFPGDVPSRCELLGGAIQDLSVFFRKGQVEAQVDVTTVSEASPLHWVPTGRWNFAFAATGAMMSDWGELSTGDALRLDLTAPLAADESITLRTSGSDQRTILISLA